MKTVIDNNQNKFLVQRVGLVGSKEIVCNLCDIVSVLAEFEINDEVKVSRLFNGAFKVISKKELISLCDANGVNFRREFNLSFEGKRKGAIGKTVKFRGIKVVADNRELAVLKLYDNYDHVVNVKFKD